jgi:predicted transcriptional regulator
MTTTVTIRLRPEHRRALLQLARSKDWTMSEALRAALSRWMMGAEREGKVGARTRYCR